MGTIGFSIDTAVGPVVITVWVSGGRVSIVQCDEPSVNPTDHMERIVEAAWPHLAGTLDGTGWVLIFPDTHAFVDCDGAAPAGRFQPLPDCPRCGGAYPDRNQVGRFEGLPSRVDPDTRVCGQCSLEETFMLGAKKPLPLRTEWPVEPWLSR